MEDELRAMLGEISREEKAVVARVGVAEALKEMATCSPLIARAFIEPDLLSEDLLSASLDLLGSKECAQELEAPLQEVVTAVVAAAGLYPRHVRRLFDLLISADPAGELNLDKPINHELETYTLNPPCPRVAERAPFATPQRGNIVFPLDLTSTRACRTPSSRGHRS